MGALVNCKFGPLGSALGPIPINNDTFEKKKINFQLLSQKFLLLPIWVFFISFSVTFNQLLIGEKLDTKAEIRQVTQSKSKIH